VARTSRTSPHRDCHVAGLRFPALSRQWSLAGDTGPARKARWCRPELAKHHEAARSGLEPGRETVGHACDTLGVGARADPEDDRASLANEGQAPFRRDRRPRKRLRDHDTVGLERLILGPSVHDPQVRQLARPALEKVALPALGLEERHVEVGERSRKRDPGRAAARADVDDRAVLGGEERDAAERVVEQNTACLLSGERGQTRRRDDRREPAVEERFGVYWNQWSVRLQSDTDEPGGACLGQT